MTSVEDAFGKAKADNRAALVGYLPAGFPTAQGAIEAALAMAAAGADVIEIGLPYSDPLMDGPVIAEAVHRALTAGTRVADVLRTVEAVAAAGVPVLVMTYWNPVERHGVRAFARDLAAAGGSGLITPDLSPEEAGPWLEASDEQGLDRVFLAAPSSTDQRLAAIAKACRGFVYAASLMGITGTRDAVGSQAEGLVGRIRAHTELPVGVGLGVSNGAQAAQIAAFADGVIVGSAFVRRLLDATDPAAGTNAVTELTAELSAALRRARPIGFRGDEPHAVAVAGLYQTRPCPAPPARTSGKPAPGRLVDDSPGDVISMLQGQCRPGRTHVAYRDDGRAHGGSWPLRPYLRA